MPNYKGHLAGGIIFYLLVFLLFSLSTFDFITNIIWGSSILLGSLFPDIDIKSKGQNIFYRVSIIVIFILLFLQQFLIAIIFSVLTFIPIFVRHRGIFHQLWFDSLLVFSLAFIASCFLEKYSFMIFSSATFFVLGIFSHLALDFGFRRFLGFKKN